MSRAEGDRGRERSDRYSALESLRDNIEAFTIALVMALVIKHFCVEAFKIPTSSMMPTLQGDTDSGNGDRILVDKWAYLFDGPDRWHVIVFRYPLNHAKHFIKRVAGLGGEWLKIHEGDVWTRKGKDEPWRIPAKDRRTREELYVAVYPPAKTWVGEEAGGLGRLWEMGPGWGLVSESRIEFVGGDPASLALKKRIGSNSTRASTSMSGEGQITGDARFAMRVEAGEGGVVEVVWRREDGERTALRLAPEGATPPSRLVVERKDGRWEEPLDRPLVAGRPVAVELECLDARVHVHLDGREVLTVEVPRSLEDTPLFDGSSQRFEIQAQDGPVAIEDLRIDRDIWYTTEGMSSLDDGQGLWIPEGHYFMLGDNSPHSSDSRKWTYRTVHLVDGREISWDTSQNGYPDTLADGRRQVVDMDGIERTWWPAEEDETVPSPSAKQNAPFVPRRLVVGRAFFIFWPLFPDFPGRLRIIR